MSHNYYNELIIRLDALIRKYYRQKIIKGILFSTALIFAVVLAIALAEYFGYFGTRLRATLFFGYVLLATTVLVRYVVIPITKVYRIGKTISYSDATTIVQKHFPQIQDKILNALQLGSQLNLEKDEQILISAAIEQKAKQFTGLNFSAAISPKEWKKRIPYAAGTAMTFLIAITLFPAMVKDPIKRIAMYETEFQRPERFRFIVSEEKLHVLHGEDFELVFKTEGEIIPADVIVKSTRGNTTALTNPKGEFRLKFNSVKEDIQFSLIANGVTSDLFTIKCLPRSRINEIEIEVRAPEYTQIDWVRHRNKTDLIVPVGSQLVWTFYTEDTEEINSYLSENLQLIQVSEKEEDIYKAEFFVYNTGLYIIKPENRYQKHHDSIVVNITVIPDLNPQIKAEFETTGGNDERIHVTGTISDDYGFSVLKRVIHMYDENANIMPFSDTTVIAFDLDKNNQGFFDLVETIGLERKLVREIRIWYEVSDNDRITGPKTTRSQAYTKRILSIDEIADETKTKKDEFVKESLAQKSLLEEIRKEIEELQKTILQKENVTWDESRRLSELIEKQAQVVQSLEAEKLTLEDLNERMERLHSDDIELLNRFKEMSELFEKVVDDELKKKIEELRSMLKNLEQSTMKEQLENLQLTNEELMRQLDRNIELFKRLDVENRIKELAERLQELATVQEKIQLETEDASNPMSEINRKQQEIKDEFNQIESELKETQEANEALEHSMDIPDMTEEIEEINEALRKALSSMSEGERQRMMRIQGGTSKNMKEMSQMLMDALMNNMMEQMTEDINSLRQILENLIELSFNQENIQERTLAIDRNDPRYMQLMDDQHDIQEQLENVSDSLIQLAKRQISIQSFVIKETEKAKAEVNNTIESLANRNVQMAGTRQQFAMTSINSLSLMLSEVIENMMNQMNQMQAGQGMGCPRPGQGKPSIGQIRNMQNQLKSQLESMMKDLAGKKEGQQGSDGTGGISERFARMAAQQEELRRRLQEVLNELMSQTGLREPGLQRAIQDMEMTEKELINKNISRETILRQERITTRLLESEKAQLEREYEERRESEEAKQYERLHPGEAEIFSGANEIESEIIRRTTKELIHFYRNRSEEYLLKILSHDRHTQTE